MGQAFPCEITFGIPRIILGIPRKKILGIPTYKILKYKKFLEIPSNS